MGHIKGDDVKGAWLDGRLWCKDCIKGGELNNVGQEDLLLEDEMNDEDFYFCDECKERI